MMFSPLLTLAAWLSDSCSCSCLSVRPFLLALRTEKCRGWTGGVWALIHSDCSDVDRSQDSHSKSSSSSFHRCLLFCGLLLSGLQVSWLRPAAGVLLILVPRFWGSWSRSFACLLPAFDVLAGMLPLDGFGVLWVIQWVVVPLAGVYC